MKWTKIEKAKVKFGQEYLLAGKFGRPVAGYLEKSEETQKGIVHSFKADGYDDLQIATHVAIVTEPGEE